MENGLLITLPGGCKLTEKGGEKWKNGSLVEVDYFESCALYYGILQSDEVQERLKNNPHETEESAVKHYIENFTELYILLNEYCW